MSPVRGHSSHSTLTIPSGHPSFKMPCVTFSHQENQPLEISKWNHSSALCNVSWEQDGGVCGGSLLSVLSLSQASMLTGLSLLAVLQKHLKVPASLEWPSSPRILHDWLEFCLFLFCPVLRFPRPVRSVKTVCPRRRAEPLSLCPDVESGMQGGDGERKDGR